MNEENEGDRYSQEKHDGQPDEGQDHPHLREAGAEKQGNMGLVVQQVVPLQHEEPGSDEKGEAGQPAEMNLGPPRQVQPLTGKQAALPPVKQG